MSKETRLRQELFSNFRHGLSSFFQHLPDRLPGDGAGQLEFHRLVGQQSQRPAGGPFWWCAAGHGHQVGFLLSIKFAPLSRPRQVIEGALQPACYEALPHPADRGGAHHQGFRHLLVGKAFIGFAQNQRPLHFTPRGLAPPGDTQHMKGQFIGRILLGATSALFYLGCASAAQPNVPLAELPSHMETPEIMETIVPPDPTYTPVPAPTPTRTYEQQMEVNKAYLDTLPLAHRIYEQDNLLRQDARQQLDQWLKQAIPECKHHFGIEKCIPAVVILKPSEQPTEKCQWEWDRRVQYEDDIQPQGHYYVILADKEAHRATAGYHWIASYNYKAYVDGGVLNILKCWTEDNTPEYSDEQLRHGW